MNTTTLMQSNTQVTNFTFRSSWMQAINRIRAKSTRSRLLQAIVTYAFTHEFTLTGNSTIDSLMTIIADQIDTQLGRPNNFKEPLPKEQPQPRIQSQSIAAPPQEATETKANTNPPSSQTRQTCRTSQTSQTTPKTPIHPKLPKIPLHILRGRAPKLKSHHPIRKHHKKFHNR